ncbi:MAG: amidohydrolase family protein [Albidovulum sp.]|nr:amidohydrolase family protein [Albidovulum sp.]
MTAEPADLNADELRAKAVAAARGVEPFDLLLAGGQVADVITGKLRTADVGVSGPLIASVHPAGTRRDALKTCDAAGMVIAPGLIDAHMHIESSMVTPRTYGETVLKRGVTTIVWDPHEFGNVWGVKGVIWAVKQAGLAPLRVLTLAPSCIPSAPGLETSGAEIDADSLREVLSLPGIHGLAEVMDMNGVVAREPRMASIVQQGLLSGKPIFGHARSLTGADLNAYAASGISSDHEITSSADLRSKIESGLFIELRGSHDHLLPDFVRTLLEYEQLPQTVTLCTDDVFPDDLSESGGVDDVVRRLIHYGMPPMNALRAATLNAASRLLRQDLGAVAPGRRADIVVFDDLISCKAEFVFLGGVEADQLKIPAPTFGALPRAMSLRPFCSEDFEVRSQSRRVRVATIDQPRFTKWGEAVADVVNGRVLAPIGAIRMAVVNRHGSQSSPKVAFLRGWGDWRGAFCTTVSHDSHNLTVFGSDTEDMAVAANAVLAAGGGLAVASDGAVNALLPLPIAGLVSERPVSEVGASFKAVRTAMDDIVTWKPPYGVFKACFGASLACNPGPHLTDLGIADMARQTILASPVLGAA